MHDDPPTPRRPTYEELAARVEQLERRVAEQAAVEAERSSEQQLRTIFEDSPMSMAIVAADGTIEYINRRSVETFGFVHAEVPTMERWSELAYPDEDYRAAVTARWTSLVAKAWSSGHDIERAEYRVTCKDGTVKTTEIFGVIVREKVIAMFDDITQRKRAEAELRESKALLLKAFNNSPLLMTISDLATGRYIEVNDSFTRVSGFSRDEAIGRTSVELGWIRDDDRARMLAVLQRDGKVADLELQLCPKTGPTVVCRFWGDVVETARGPRLFSAAEDITERKKAEAELFESNARLSAVVGGSPIGIVVSRADDGRIVDVNDAALQLYGYTREEALGRTPFELGTYAVPARRAEMVQRLNESGSIHQFPVEFRRRSGEVGVLELSGSLITLRGVPCILTMLVDVTARKQAEQAQARLQVQLQQAQKMESVGRLAGGVAHDFNNMLGVILGHADVALARTDASDPLHTHLEAVRAAARRSVDLTRQILGFARKQTVAPRALDLNATVAGMLSMLRRLIGEDIQLDWAPGDGLWPVHMDPTQIDQILANLCVNARDAIESVGRLRIETDNRAFDDADVAQHPGAHHGEYVRLAVTDDGSGMDDEVLAHLFEPFFTTKGVGRGTGLGLATVYGIVEQSRGFIDVRSRPGEGTTFTVHLPRYRGDAEAAPRPAPATSPRRGSETILLVEDERAVLTLTSAMLEEMGYAVLAAGTPAEAVQMAQEHAGEIHLLLTDVVMPAMNGRVLAESLRRLRPAMRCVFMSGYTAEVIGHHGVLDAEVLFLQKPFSSGELASKVREALDERAGGRGSRAP